MTEMLWSGPDIRTIIVLSLLAGFVAFLWWGLSANDRLRCGERYTWQCKSDHYACVGRGHHTHTRSCTLVRGHDGEHNVGPEMVPESMRGGSWYETPYSLRDTLRTWLKRRRCQQPEKTE
jgi:hypothetical protein